MSNEKPVDAYKASVDKKLQANIDLIIAKPETWSQEERDAYEGKTMIDWFMTNRTILVQAINYKAKTAGGLILEGIEGSRPAILGMVVSIAPDCKFLIGDQGEALKGINIKAGDVVMYAVYNGDEINILGNSFYRVKDFDIHSKIPDSKVVEIVGDKSDALWTIRKQMTYNENNPNNIGPKSKLHVDNYENKLLNKKDKLN